MINEEKQHSLLDLPNDLLASVLTYLNGSEFVRSNEISKKFHMLFETNTFLQKKINEQKLKTAKEQFEGPKYKILLKCIEEASEPKNQINSTVNENSNEPTEKEKPTNQNTNSDSENSMEQNPEIDEMLLLQLYKDPKEFSRVKKHIFERTKIETKQYEKCASNFAFLAFLGIFGTFFLAMYPLFYWPKSQAAILSSVIIEASALFLICMLIRYYIAAYQNLKHHRIGTATIKNENPFLQESFQNRFFLQPKTEEIDEEKGLSNDNAGIQNKGKEKLSDEKTPLLTGAPGKEEEGNNSESYGTLSA